MVHSNLSSLGEHIKVLIEDLSSHPHCAHGPTLLFQRRLDSSDRIEEFFACSACRSRKECAFQVRKGRENSHADGNGANGALFNHNMIDQDDRLRKVIRKDGRVECNIH